ncbi:MAG: mannosyltransferase family protein [Actinomycetota bacterium]
MIWGAPSGPNAWFEALKLVAFTRAIYLGVAYLAASFLASTDGSSDIGVLDMWTRWDARHFLEVAEFGYTDPRTDPHATAFFPLWPLLVRALSATGLSPALAAMLLSAVASVVAVAFLYRLAEEELGGHDAGRRASLYLLFFPTAVFLVAPYSESLFLAGAIPAFYYARRGRWLVSGTFAAIAMGTRAAGAFLLVGLLLEFVRRRDFSGTTLRRALAAEVVALLPLAAFGAYLWQVKGDPLYFFTDQRLGWGRVLSGPLEALRATWDVTRVDAGEGALTNFVIGWRVEIAAMILGTLAVVWALIKREWGYAGFMGVFLASLATSSIYLSVPRMLLSMFPIVLFLAGWTGRDSRRHETVLLVFAAIAMLGVVALTRQAWFY